VLMKTPVRDLLALLVNGSNPSTDTSWGFILRHYPGAAVDLVRSNVGFLRRGEWYTAFYLCGGVVAFLALVRRRSGDPFAQMLIAGSAAALAYVLAAPVFSAFRLELVFLPMAAFGLASAVERVAARVAAQRRWPVAVPAPARARRG